MGNQATEDIIPKVETNYAAPYDVVVKVTDGEFALQLAFHSYWSTGDTRGAHEHARCFSTPAASNSSTSGGCSKADLCIPSASGSVTRFTVNSPVSWILT
jgi:hypothetical protein